MKRQLAAFIAAFACAASAAARPVADHLSCYKVKDPQAKAKYTADLSGLVAQSGCTIKVPATMACVAATKENVQPTPPGGGGTGTPNAFGCYKVKCPKTVVPPFQLNDQFGSRVVTPAPSKLICAPAAPTCSQPFEPTIAAFVNAFASALDASGNFEAAVSCGGSPSVCCPGGVPSMPCGPLHADLTGVSFALPPGVNNRVDLSLRMSLKTVADLPVSVPLVGDCGVHVDTAPGASSTIQVDVPLNLSADGLHVNALGAVSLTGLTTDDVSLTGGFGCQLADLGLGFFLNTLQATLVQSVVPFEGLCLGHESTP